MSNEELQLMINNVGQTCFVNFYRTFSSEKPISEKVEILKNRTFYQEDSIVSRVNTANTIVQQGLSAQAMLSISKSTSPNVTDYTKKCAYDWFLQLQLH